MNSKAFNRFFYISLAVLAIIYGIGMTLPLMDVDSSTYALLSKQMLQSGHYLQLYLNGADYLDKPPLVF
jgi:4-amino-4-deoxy-L-arabinose transferase-like glycosyltransferase